MRGPSYAEKMALVEFEGNKDLEEWGDVLRFKCTETFSDVHERGSKLHEEMQLLWAINEVQNCTENRQNILCGIGDEGQGEVEEGLLWRIRHGSYRDGVRITFWNSGESYRAS